MKQRFYRIIYSPGMNMVLRTICRRISWLLPEALKLSPVGRVRFSVGGRSFSMETNQTSHLTRVLYWRPVGSFEYVTLFTQLVPRIGSFVDVGANIGLYSLLAAEFGTDIKVLALEPSSGPLHFLRRNVGLARYKERIRVLPIAASNKPGSTVFNEVRNAKYPFTQYHLNGDGGFIPHSAEQNSTKVQVRMEPLDGVIASGSFGRVDLIKIDTEGTENDVLAGAMELLQRDLPIVICEMLFGRIENELESIMKPLGYQFYSHTPAGLVLRPTLRRKEDDGISNVFFVHPSKEHLIASFIVRDGRPDTAVS